MAAKNTTINTDDLKRASKEAKDFSGFMDMASATSKKIAENLEEIRRLSKQVGDIDRDIAKTNQEKVRLSGELAKLGNIDIIRGNIEARQKIVDEMSAERSQLLESLSLDKARQEAMYRYIEIQKAQNSLSSDQIAALQTQYAEMVKTTNLSQMKANAHERALTNSSKILSGLIVKQNKYNDLQSKIKGADEAIKSGELMKDSLNDQISKLQNKKIILKDINSWLANESVGYKKIGGLIQSTHNPLSFMVELIKGAFDRFLDLDKAAEAFRRETGLIKTQTVGIEKSVQKTNVELARFGVTLEKAYAAASALTSEFQSIDAVSEDMIRNTAMYSANLGISEKSTAQIYGKFSALAVASGTTADNVILTGSALSNMAGVPINLVMKDMAEASGETLMFLAKSPVAMMKTAVEARRMGTTLDSMAKSARGLLNFQDSITSEMEASALLGRNVNFQLARQLAFEGDIEGSRKAALEQIKMAGDFSKMNVYQQEALAKASGMTVEEILKQQNQEKQLAAMRAKNPELADKYNTYLKESKKLTAETTADLAKKGEELANQAMMQSELNKITGAFGSIWTTIQDSIVPIANVIIPNLASALQGIAQGFQWLNEKSKFITIGLLVGMLALSFWKLGSALKWVSSGFGKLTKFTGLDKIGESVKKLGGGAGKGVGDFLGGLSKGLKSMGNPKVLFGALNLIPAAIGLVAMIPALITVGALALLGIPFAAGAKGFSKGMGYLGSPSVLKGALGLLILGAAMVPFAYAMSLMKGFEWKDLTVAAVAIVGFSLAAAGIGFLAPYILMGSLAIGALGISIGLFGLGLKAVAWGMEGFVKCLGMMVDPILQLTGVGPGLMLAALGIYAVAGAMAAFGAGAAVAGIGNFVGKLFGGDMIGNLKELASMSDRLLMVADSLKQIQESVASFTKIDSGGLKNTIGQLKELKSLQSKSVLGELAEFTKVVTAPIATVANNVTGGGSSGTEKKLDELINLMKSGAIVVNIDGKKMSNHLATTYGQS